MERDRGEHTEGNTQRGTDREEETERSVRVKETKRRDRR